MYDKWYLEPAVADLSFVREAGLTFLKRYTGESDDSLIQARVHDVWKTCLNDPVKYPVYKCVRELMFIQPKITSHQRYAELVSDSGDKDRKRVLEIGACFGTDTRTLILDGIKRENITAVDVVDPYWYAGLDLFIDKDTLGVKYLVGDIISDERFAGQVCDSQSGSGDRGFDLVWSGLVFHVLERKAQEGLVSRIYGLMKSGGRYFGTCVGNTEGSRIMDRDGYQRFINSVQTCMELLEAAGFTDIDVRVGPDFEALGWRDAKAPNVSGHCLLEYSAKKP